MLSLLQVAEPLVNYGIGLLRSLNTQSPPPLADDDDDDALGDHNSAEPEPVPLSREEKVSLAHDLLTRAVRVLQFNKVPKSDPVHSRALDNLSKINMKARRRKYTKDL